MSSRPPFPTCCRSSFALIVIWPSPRRVGSVTIQSCSRYLVATERPQRSRQTGADGGLDLLTRGIHPLFPQAVDVSLYRFPNDMGRLPALLLMASSTWW